jgi:cell division septation protein DedD
VDLEDFIEPEVGVAVAVTAAVASPKVRQTLRKGAVYGLAGLLIARDRVASWATRVSQQVRSSTPANGQGAASEQAEAAPAPAPPQPAAS